MPARRSPSSAPPPPGSTPRLVTSTRSFTTGLGDPLFTVVSADAGHCIARYGAIVISVWRKTMTMHTLGVLRRAAEDALARHPHGIASFNLVENSVTFATPEERQAASKLFADFRQHVLFCASTLEGDGFWASTGRSLVTAMAVVARIPFPLRMFRYVSDAAAWQARFPAGVSPLALTEAVERCRAKMGPR